MRAMRRAFFNFGCGIAMTEQKAAGWSSTNATYTTHDVTLVWSR